MKRTSILIETNVRSSAHTEPYDLSKAEYFEAVAEMRQQSLRRAWGKIRKYREEIYVADKLIAERNRLINAIPQCPVHGPCIPYSIEWVEKAILMMQGLKAENEALRKDAERYRWMRASTDHYGEMYFGFADESETDRVIDEAMTEDLAQKAGLI